MSEPEVPLVVVYADESCLGNGREGNNPGGAAGLIEAVGLRSGECTRRDYWISEPATTNNRMALRSVIEAFRVLAARGRQVRVRFVTDSNYIVKGFTEWLPEWIERGWRRKTGEIENLALWQEAADASRRIFRIEWKWVRGHAGHPQNEYSNHLAVRAARTQDASGGAVPSGFNAWLEAERLAGRVKVEPDPFPDPSQFRPSRALPGDKTGRPV